MVPSSPYFSLSRYTRGGVGGRGEAIAPAFRLHNPLPHLPTHSSPLLSYKNTFPFPQLKKPNPPKPLFHRLNLPAATLSSFASADDEPKAKADAKTEEAPETGEVELSEMAKAFHISSRTASAICILIAFAALSLPLTMRSLAQGASLKTKALSYVTLLSGFYMAWNIGANDVANAMGTSVGSGALTLRQAVLTAAVLEFSGAFLMGTHVTSTMQKGILVASVFQGKDSMLFAGLLSSLAAAGTWLQV